MRVLSANDSARRENGHFALRVLVRDAGGTFRDLATVAGFNLLRRVTWTESVDSPGMDADVELWRNLDAVSASPLHTTSPLNRATPFDATTAVSALIDLNRQVRIEWSLTGDAGDTPSWVRAFEGLIESFSLDSGESMSFGCRGQHAELQDRLFEEEVVFAAASGGEAGAFRIWQPNTAYALNTRILPAASRANGRHYQVTTAGTSGATEPTWPTSGTVADGTCVHTHVGTTSLTAGYPVQNVMTQMAQHVIAPGAAVFGDLGTTISVYVPASPGWNINVFKVPRENVWNELTKLAQQIGWELRWKWSTADSAFRLTLYDPNRTKTTPDFAFALSDVREYSTVDLDISNIRNVVRVVYSDSADRDAKGVAKRKSVTVTDATSITRFGRRYMEVGESSSSAIDSAAEATTMANAILSDLASPLAEVECDLRFFPWVEVTDLLRLPADGRRFTSSQDLAVTSYTHSWEEGRKSTRVRVRGKPSSGYYRWAAVSGAGNPADVGQVLILPNPNVIQQLTSVPRGQTFTVSSPAILANTNQWLDSELHVSATSSFTPSGSTLAGKSATDIVAGLKPGNTYYARTTAKAQDAQGRTIIAPTSLETSFVAGYIEPCDLNPESLGRLFSPPNGDFEGWFLGDTQPPDHWEPAVGTWADWVRTSGGNGAYSIGARDTGVSVRAELRSVWFPAQPSKAYGLSALLKRIAADGDVRFTVEWGDAAKAAISSEQFVVSTSGFTAWGPTERWLLESPSTALWVRVYVGRHVSGTLRFSADAIELDVIGDPIQTPTLNADFGNVGGTDAPAAFWRDKHGLVRLRGLIEALVNTGGVDVLLTLPAGYRPVNTETFLAAPNGLEVRVNSGGDVTLTQPLTAGDVVSLSGLVFDTR